MARADMASRCWRFSGASFGLPASFSHASCTSAVVWNVPLPRSWRCAACLSSPYRDVHAASSVAASPASPRASHSLIASGSVAMAGKVRAGRERFGPFLTITCMRLQLQVSDREFGMNRLNLSSQGFALAVLTLGAAAPAGAEVLLGTNTSWLLTTAAPAVGWNSALDFNVSNWVSAV